MKSRRLIAFPELMAAPKLACYFGRLQQGMAASEIGPSKVYLRRNNPEPGMSVEGLEFSHSLGQNPNASRTLARRLWPATDMPPHGFYSAMCHDPTLALSIEHLVSAQHQRQRDIDA
jgi:hypothetical protein